MKIEKQIEILTKQCGTLLQWQGQNKRYMASFEYRRGERGYGDTEEEALEDLLQQFKPIKTCKKKKQT